MKVVDWCFCGVFNGLRYLCTARGIFDYLGLKPNSKISQTKAISIHNHVVTTKARLTEQSHIKLLKEKNSALKAQLKSQNHLAQVAAELTPTLNELGSLAHVSAEHWRDDRDNADGNEFAERLEFTSCYVLSIVQDFADLAKFKTGDIALNQQEIDCNELIKDVASAVQGFAD